VNNTVQVFCPCGLAYEKAFWPGLVFSHSSVPLRFHGHFSRWTWVSWYENVSILAFIRTNDDGGGDNNWSYKT